MAVTADAAPAVAFKGRMMTLTVLEIRHDDQQALATELTEHLQRAPGFFQGMPVILSLIEANVDLADLARLVRDHDLVPVAVLDGEAGPASAAGLGVISSQHTIGGDKSRTTSAQAQAGSDRTPEQDRPSHEQQDQEQQETASRGAARLINRPVRSGQQVYARGGDLVIASSVSEGAEVLADGHIHIYGALRGRAIAGAAGDSGARIFCHRFEPDLVAVAGCYKVADDIDEGARGKSVQVRFAEDNLTIDIQE